jgi:putative FmdB family regulatory protein
MDLDQLQVARSFTVPLYEYRCTQCGHQFEKIQTFSAADEKECPLCQSLVERLISAPAVHFSGSGFYQTDYKGKSKSGAAASGSTSTQSASSDSTSSSGADISSAGPATPKVPAAGTSSGTSSSTGSSSAKGS